MSEKKTVTKKTEQNIYYYELKDTKNKNFFFNFNIIIIFILYKILYYYYLYINKNIIQNKTIITFNK